MSIMSTLTARLNLLLVLATGLFLAGCTAPRFTPIASVPPDKALVYIYRKAHIAGSLSNHRIAVNGQRVTSLYNSSYYPYLASPDTNRFGFALFSPSWALNLAMKDDDLFRLKTEAGETYYLQLKTATMWGPKIVQIDEETGKREITGCRLAKEWK
jgi:hypothetical protein